MLCLCEESILGVDFKQEENVRRLMMEAMRFHPLVTTLPYWVKSPDTATGQGKWEPEAVCIEPWIKRYKPTLFFEACVMCLYDLH